MKIGISALGYECKEHLESVLAPWKSKDIKAQVIISVAHGIFPETHALGFPSISTDGSVDELKNLKNKDIIQELVVIERPTYEKDLRNHTLPFLFDNRVDWLWMLDLQDEIYTVEQINGILNYIQHPERAINCWYKINFKNYVFGPKTYVDDFVAPRLWRTDRCGGISGFYYDNEIMFNNNVKAEFLFNEQIPKDIAFVKHLSWVGSPEYLKRKISFQKLHYGECSYAWDEKENKLVFNESYYNKFKKAKPTIYQDS